MLHPPRQKQTYLCKGGGKLMKLLWCGFDLKVGLCIEEKIGMLLKGNNCALITVVLILDCKLESSWEP